MFQTLLSPLALFRKGGVGGDFVEEIYEKD